jgi:hypothetical protein
MGPPSTNLAMIAEDFRTDGDASHDVSELCWWGAYTNMDTTNPFSCTNLPGDIDHFFVTIYDMNNGLPDINAVVGNAEQGVNMTVTRRAFCTGGTVLTFEFHATLNAPVSLQANHCYALEIRNPNDNSANWFWSRSADVANGQAWTRSGDLTTPYSAASTIAGDRNFCMNVGLDIFQATCAVPPPPICSNPDTNGQPFAGVNLGGFSASPSPNAVGLQLAERFQFVSSGNITNVCFRGFWVSLIDGTQPTGPDAPDFDIAYYANSNGQPGDVIAQFHVGDPDVNVFRQGFQYRIEHPPVAVEAGTCYFFSISRISETADPEHNLRFAWWLTAPGSIGDDMAHSRTAGGATPGPWANIAFGAGQGDIHFLFDEGSVETPNCPATQGACCVGTTCMVTDEAGCAGMGGVFQGIGVQCGGSSCLNPPANDNCASASAISGEGDFPYDNRAATCEGAERPATCGTSSNSIWFNWTAPCEGSFTIANCDGSLDDTVMAAYEGTDCANSTELACGDDTCGIGGGPSSVTINATAGGHYLIRIASWTATDCAGADGATGTLHISRDGGACPQACACDFNSDNVLNSQDFFDFLNCFFTSGCANADYNHDMTVNSQDFFDFLNCFFMPPAGCD